MELLSSRPGDSNPTRLDQSSRVTSGEPCLAYLGHGNIKKKSIPRETEASPSNTSGVSQNSSRESTKPIEKDTTGWPEELPSRNIYDYPERDYDPQVCVKHLRALNLYWCPLDIVKDHLPCCRFFMAKVHQLYGEKASAPPSDPAVRVPIPKSFNKARSSHLQNPDVDVCSRDGGKVCVRITNVRITRTRSENVEPLREPKRSRSFIKSVAEPVDVERSEVSRPRIRAETGGAERSSVTQTPSIDVADVGRSPAEACEPEAKLSFADFGRSLRRGLTSVKTSCSSPLVGVSRPSPACSPSGELKLAHFTFDESMHVPESRYDPGIPFTIDERAKKERLTWDQVKHRATECCYHMITKVGLQPSNRRKSFEVSAVLLTVVLHLRPGELRNIRWRDLKAHYVAFPDNPRKAGQRVDCGTFTEVIIELLKSWRTDAELDSDLVFDFTERTFERITHRILGSDRAPKDLRLLKEFHVIDESPEQYSLVKALRMLKAGAGLRSGELWKTPEETHRYDTGLEHGFIHPDPMVTRHIKKRKMSGWKGKGVDH